MAHYLAQVNSGPHSLWKIRTPSRLMLIKLIKEERISVLVINAKISL